MNFKPETEQYLCPARLSGYRPEMVFPLFRFWCLRCVLLPFMLLAKLNQSYIVVPTFRRDQ